MPVMPPACQVCAHSLPKYTCADCGLLSYVEFALSEPSLTCKSCSLPCYKLHKIDCHAHAHAPPASTPQTDDTPPDPPSLRPLTSLKWPYAPEEAAYPDPLKRDD